MSIAETEDVLSTAAAWRSAGEQVAVATVTETWGSSPRPAGSQMAVTKSGKMAGSVSGGSPLSNIAAYSAAWRRAKSR